MSRWRRCSRAAEGLRTLVFDKLRAGVFVRDLEGVELRRVGTNGSAVFARVFAGREAAGVANGIGADIMGRFITEPAKN